MLKVKNLNKVYGADKSLVHALKDINLEVNKGEIYGIIGLSGAGKSTLIRTLNLLEKPNSGVIELDGENILNFSDKKLRDMRSQMGMIFQSFNLLSSLTVYENVELPLKIAKKKDRKEKVTELLNLVGLLDKKDSFPSQLSGGQKQRVGIARALANDPKLLLCDEPTSALDPITTKSILSLLKEINTKFNLTMVLITHDMSVIKELCHKVAVISNGEIVESGDVFDIFTEPRANATKEFLLEDSFVEKENFRSNGVKYLNLEFKGDGATEPIISNGLRRIPNIDLNILKGTIEDINYKKLGRLLVSIKGDEKALNEYIAFLKEHQVKVEVL